MADTHDRVDFKVVATKQYLSSKEIAAVETLSIETRFDFFVRRVKEFGVAYCLEDEDGLFLAESKSDSTNLLPIWSTVEHACIMQRLSELEAWIRCAVVPVTLTRLVDLLLELDNAGDLVLIEPSANASGAVAPAINLRQEILRANY